MFTGVTEGQKQVKNESLHRKLTNRKHKNKNNRNKKQIILNQHESGVY